MKTFWRSGEPFIWITGGALAISLLLVAGLIVLVLANGLGFFWPHEVVRLTLDDGREIQGEITDREPIPQPDATPGTPERYRIQVKQGNRDLYGADFLWVDEDSIVARERPDEIVVLERLEWGNLYGTLRELHTGDGPPAPPGEERWEGLLRGIEKAHQLRDRIRSIKKTEIGAINEAQEAIRLEKRRLEIEGGAGGSEFARLDDEKIGLDRRFAASMERVSTLRKVDSGRLVLAIAGGDVTEVPLAQIVRAFRPNAIGWSSKTAYCVARAWEFLTAEPRESNTEGGVFPAIFGTVLMVLIMSVIVTPLGVLAAFYLREYARQGVMVSAVRIAVNNLAGVPSIVFGVFGVGFFIYFVGGGVDRMLYPERLPTPTFGTGGILWASLTLALLTVPVVIVATEEGLAAIPRGMREASLALGATKFETTLRVVLPAVLPSILTGLILAMARAAGEVAPLMITGVVKLAPALPIDSSWPFIHLERKFMHLGFHIYDVGFQSPNVDAARPMVFATTLLLLGIVVLMNVGATVLRNRLRRRLTASAL